MLSKLIEIQGRERWTDLQMAGQLRVSRSAWNMVRNGRVPLSERLQMNAARAFPELVGDLLTQVSVGKEPDR